MYLSEICKKVGMDNDVDQRKNLWVMLAYKTNIKSKKKILLMKSFLYVGNKDVFAYQTYSK